MTSLETGTDITKISNKILSPFKLKELKNSTTLFLLITDTEFLKIHWEVFTPYSLNLLKKILIRCIPRISLF